MIHQDLYAEMAQEGEVDPARVPLSHLDNTLQLVLTRHRLVVGESPGVVVPSAAYSCFSVVTLIPSFKDMFVNELVTRALTEQTLR